MKIITYKQFDSAIRRHVNKCLKDGIETYSAATVENHSKVIVEQRPFEKTLVVVDTWRSDIKNILPAN